MAQIKKIELDKDKILKQLTVLSNFNMKKLVAAVA